MKLKFVIAAAVLAATPAFAQGQMGGPQQKAPKPTKAQVQQVVQSVVADKSKLQAYCALGKLQQEMSQLDEKKDAKKAEELANQADAQAQKLGPEFGTMMDGLDEVDPNSAEGKEYMAILENLDKQCK
ncbi:MAG TPA: hypothetical protein VLX44_12140 [Xanthobacteraceae bacterium]|nr:hypothetical protein [Xanthobacteraceae bacterium]